MLSSMDVVCFWRKIFDAFKYATDSWSEANLGRMRTKQFNWFSFAFKSLAMAVPIWALATRAKERHRMAASLKPISTDALYLHSTQSSSNRINKNIASKVKVERDTNSDARFSGRLVCPSCVLSESIAMHGAIPACEGCKSLKGASGGSTASNASCLTSGRDLFSNLLQTDLYYPRATIAFRPPPSKKLDEPVQNSSIDSLARETLDKLRA